MPKLISASLLTGLASLFALGAHARELTLSEALARVESDSLEVLISRESVNQALEQQRQSRSGLLPQITLDATQRRSLPAAVGANLVRAGVTNRFDAQLNARLDLLNPVNLARYQAAKMAVNVAELGEAGVRQTIMATVAETYFAHLRNLERTTLLDDNIARARRLLDLAQNQLNAGVATQIDVTRAEAQVAVAEQARLQQTTVVRGSALQLKRLLALELNAPVELAPAALARLLPNEASVANDAMARRPELQSARALLEQNELEVRAARYARMPSLALLGNYGYATEYAFDGNEAKIWSAAAAISFPVFDGAETRALTGYARSRQRAQSLRVRNLETQVAAELELARQDATSRLAQIGVAETQFTLAREELELAEKRFEQGVADNREMIEAQGRLATAGDNLVEAVYLYNVSRVELARVAGDVRDILPATQ
ncbi:MAG: TolC family protein [Opitutaceae bacterium]|nr:TolC family protein [Opitutaceae bacterium]